MKDFNKIIISSLMAAGLFMSTVGLYAQAAPVDEECSEEVIISYFPEPFVKQTLKDNNIPEAQWTAIVEALKNKNGEVVKFVEEKAAAMNPNPLKDPKHRDEAIAIFREALLTSFSDVMSKNGVTDQKQLQTMLDDIQKQKAKRFSECLEKHIKKMQK